MLTVDIQKSFPDFNLKVNFETKESIVALLGASGSGKSLTLKCIAGIENPDKGRIVLNDRVLFDSEQNINLKVQDRRVAYLFQNYALFPTKTVYENIKFGILKEDINKSAEIIKEIIRKMKLTGLEKRKPHELSGGQQQRTALARILVNKPEILLLDEPFSALDSFLKWDLAYELEEILAEYDLEAILVTHDEQEVRRLADEVCILSSGKSEDIKPIENLFITPTTKASAVLSGIENFSSLSIEGDILIADDWNTSLGNVREFLNDDLNYCLVAFRNDSVQFADCDKCLPIDAYVIKVVRKSHDLMDLILKTESKDGTMSKIGATINRELYKSNLLNIKPGNNIKIYVPKEKLILLTR